MTFQYEGRFDKKLSKKERKAARIAKEIEEMHNAIKNPKKYHYTHYDIYKDFQMFDKGYDINYYNKRNEEFGYLYKDKG